MKFFKPEDFVEVFRFYGVSLDGTQVCNFRTGKILKITRMNNGYLAVKLRHAPGEYKTWLLHRVVAHAFIGPCPDGFQVNHKDGNKENNAPSNLEYVTQSQNIKHAKETGLMPKATFRKLTDQQILDIKTLLEIRKRCDSLYPKHKHIAIMFRVSHGMIDAIEKGKHWND